MDSLIPLIEKMVASRMANSIQSSSLFVTELSCALASLMLVGMGLLFGLYAEYAWLKAYLIPEVAALVVSGSAFALALVFAVTVKMMSQAKKKTTSADYPADVTKTVGKLLESLSEELEDPIRENPKTALMLASLAGFAAGEKRI